MIRFLRFLSIILIFSGISFVPCLTPPAQATTVLELTDGQLVEFSSEILYGTVIKIDTVMHSNGMILTRVTMRVKKWIKGKSPVSSETFTFYTRGGSYGEISQTVSGELTPNLNDEMVVFLERIPRYDNLPMLLGLKQGAFVAERDDEDRISKVPRHNLDGLHLYKTASFESEFRSAQTLEDLISRIEKHLQGDHP